MAKLVKIDFWCDKTKLLNCGGTHQNRHCGDRGGKINNIQSLTVEICVGKEHLVLCFFFSLSFMNRWGLPSEHEGKFDFLPHKNLSSTFCAVSDWQRYFKTNLSRNCHVQNFMPLSLKRFQLRKWATSPQQRAKWQKRAFGILFV